MASRKPTGPGSKAKEGKPSRASAVPPAAHRAKGAPTTLVPKPPLPGGSAAKPQSRTSDSANSANAMPLKKQELLAKVVERSQVPKKHAKPVVDAMLAVLGDALGEGRDLNLQPMGKVKRKRAKDTGKAQVIVANIRRPHAVEGGTSAPVTPLGGGADNPANAAPNMARNAAKEAVADDTE